MRRSVKFSLFVGGLAAAVATGTQTASTQSWNPYGRCYATVEGIGTGTGVFGRGSARARAAARVNWEATVADLYGDKYARLSTARQIRWDCKRRAMLLAKCVVTAKPCGARTRG